MAWRPAAPAGQRDEAPSHGTHRASGQSGIVEGARFGEQGLGSDLAPGADRPSTGPQASRRRPSTISTNEA